MPLKIIAAADLHLGRTSSAVPDDAHEKSTIFTLKRIVNYAIAQKANMVTFSGDIIDRDNRYYEAIGPLQAEFDRLKKENISVYMVAGNHDHDVLSQIIQKEKYTHVHLLGRNGKWEATNHNADVQFIGWSFPKMHVREDPMQSFDSSALDPGKVTIGLLHTEVDTPESNYAPVTSNALANTPVSIWILGHIHKHDKLQEQKPCIVYPGSPHALSAAEPGIHGPLLIEIADNKDISVTQIPMSPARYEIIHIAIEQEAEEDTVRELISSTLHTSSLDLIEQLDEVAYLVYDIIIEGEHAHPDWIGKWATPVISDYEQSMETKTIVSVRKIHNEVQPAVENLEELAQQPSPAGKIAETMLAIQNNTSNPFLEELVREWKKKCHIINHAKTYQPLLQPDQIIEETEQEARHHILQECKKLLGSLLAQQKN